MSIEWEMGLRLILSALLAGIIGYERQASQKAAGLRTHILVCIGSCLIMILSIKLYKAVEGMTNADPARLAAQVVSGIGFLGAGSIMKEGPNIKGLTTAASLWVVSGVGLAVGCGYYMGALMSTALVFLTLTILHRIEKHHHGKLLSIAVMAIDSPGQIGNITSLLGRHGVKIKDIRIEQNEERMIMHLLLEAPEKLSYNDMSGELAEIPGVRSIQREY